MPRSYSTSLPKRIVTWNMQGGATSRADKWSNDVGAIIEQVKPRAICLQECGYPPLRGMRPLPGDPFARYARVTSIPFQRYVCRWDLGTASKPKPWHILFVETDPIGKRCNLAICTPEPPQRYFYARGIDEPGLRPAIGVDIGRRSTVWCLHAASPGGGNAGRLLTDISRESGATLPWAALGDYNVQPSELERRTKARWRVHAAGGGITRHGSDAILDYMVTNAVAPEPAESLVLSDFVASDHYAVVYGF